MSTQTPNLKYICLLAAIITWPTLGSAQVPVDESATEPVAGTEELTILSGPELEGIIGAIALYPDDLLAIVLPASTYPLQIVQAARFLEDLKSNPTLKPNPDWDDSVVALTNYPEIVQMMSDDLDWTWRLGEAVVAQQPAVIAAIERFRDRAYAAGNLKTDDHQTVVQEDGVIQITPVQEDVIYVPYYEPERVVVYQPHPVYYYYPRPYPVYYYPYPSGYAFNYGFFWGVTSAFSIGWHTDSLHIYHHSYHGHPYYGHSYWNDRWYRRPSIHVHNTYYVNNNHYVANNRYRDGDHWRPQNRRTVRTSDQRITRTRYFPSSNAVPTRTATTRIVAPSTRETVSATRVNSYRSPRHDVEFRDRPATTTRLSTQSRELQARVKEPRQPQVRRVESRQSQLRQSTPKNSQVRNFEPREPQQRQSAPRQTQLARAPSRETQVRQSQPRQVQPKTSSQPRQSNSNSSQSKSSYKSDSRSSNRNSSSHSRRDH